MSNTHTRTVSAVPLAAGSLLFIGAVSLLCEDAIHHFSLNHVLQPLLMLSTIVAGALSHHRLASWRIPSGLAFLFLALLGSTAVIYATLSRTATARDGQQADAMAMNRTLALKDEELVQAKVSAKVECKVLGDRCKAWQARVDQLTREMVPLRAVSVDPRADAIGRLAELLNLDGKRVHAIVTALDPVILPLFLEVGCILFFSAAFPHRRLQTRAPGAGVAQVLPQASERPLNTQELAVVWGVHPTTAGRRLKRLEATGQVRRHRDGRSILALPAPRVT